MSLLPSELYYHSADYWSRRRRTLVKAGLCIQAASHGPALPPYTLCEACKVRQDVKNAKYNKLRSIRKAHGES